MSSHSYMDTCPNCGNESLNCCSSNKPFDNSFGDCSRCGFYYRTTSGFSPVEEINELRADENANCGTKHRMLKNQPKQNKKLVWS